MIGRLISLIKILFEKLFKGKHLFTNRRVDTIPDKLSPRILYVEKNGDVDQFASFLCPCGCSEEINVNLEPNELPCWTLDAGRKTTLSPSIQMSGKCKSHFFIKSGLVKWCK